MATPVIMPRQGVTVESCVIGEWLKKVGDRVSVGDTLFEYETDKSTFQEEAKADGILLAIFRDVGDDVPVLTNVAVIGDESEDPAPYMPADLAGAASAAPDAASVQNIVAETAPVVGPVTPATQNSAASPRAKHLAEQLNVDYRQATGTGVDGIIQEADVRRLADTMTVAVREVPVGAEGTGIGGRVSLSDITSTRDSAAAASPEAEGAEYEIIKHSKIRQTIAKNMHYSLSTMAQVTNNMTMDATEILDFRTRLKEKGEMLGLPIVTLNDIGIYVISRVLLEYPDMNAHYFDDHIKRFKHVHMGIAVDTPRGLVVPTLRNADEKSLLEISAEARELIDQAMTGSISPDKLTGATFTLTNAGKLGIEVATPIVSAPQVCIFGMGAVKDQVRRVGGEIDVYSAMFVGVTYDHRAVDGAPAGYFLRDVCRAFENFSLTLMKG